MKYWMNVTLVEERDLGVIRSGPVVPERFHNVNFRLGTGLGKYKVDHCDVPYVRVYNDILGFHFTEADAAQATPEVDHVFGSPVICGPMAVQRVVDVVDYEAQAVEADVLRSL